MVRISKKMKNVSKGFYGFFEPPPADVIRFTVGEPDFDTPEPIKEAAIAGIKKNDTHYVGSDGRENLRVAIANKLKAENGIPADPKNVVVTIGGKEAILDAILAIVDKGDEVIIPSPAWPTYDAQVVISGGKSVPVRVRSDNYHLDLESIKASITKKTKGIILNSPNNPTGAVFPKEDMRAVADLAIDHDFVVISDEIYEKMVYGGRQHVSIGSFPDMHDRTVTVNGFSKAYAMTGWRIGYVQASGDLIEAIRLIHMHATTCTVAFATDAAVIALTQCQDHVKRMAEEYDRRRKLMRDGLSSIEGIKCPEPEGAFYAFTDIRGTGMDSRALYKKLLSEAHVMTIPGADFTFGEGYMRFSYATAYNKCAEGLERMKKLSFKPVAAAAAAPPPA